MKKFLVFHASTVDGSTVSEHASGTGVDMGTFLADDVKSIMAKNGGIEICIEETGKFNQNATSANTAGASGNDEINTLANVLVTLAVTNANIPTVMKDICRAINTGPHTDGVILFDAVNSVFPGDVANVTGITIARPTFNVVLGTS
tara:strand:+ start:114 stop:551 length:438 start_codon:yes stop_codon:yes gene_type:complete